MEEKMRDPSWKGGTRCTICSHHDAKEINRDIAEYASSRASGHEMPWSVFHRDWLAKEYKIQVSGHSTRKHALKCLGLES